MLLYEVTNTPDTVARKQGILKNTLKSSFRMTKQRIFSVDVNEIFCSV